MRPTRTSIGKQQLSSILTVTPVGRTWENHTVRLKGRKKRRKELESPKAAPVSAGGATMKTTLRTEDQQSWGTLG